MNSQEVLAGINTIFQDVLDDENLTIERATTSADVDEWSSLTHILLVVAIEKYFSVRLKGEELQSFTNVGEMCDAIVAKINAH